MAKTHRTRQLSAFDKPAPMPTGYYSGDQPNPLLNDFVCQHATPYDGDDDDYAVPAFNKAISTSKATAIYNLHTYWSKKPHDAILQYIKHYTKPGEIVLDPFCGSGGTALAALLAGRCAVAIDRSPAATFITRSYCSAFDTSQLIAAFEQVRKAVQKEMNWLYETRCDRCDSKATICYIVYSEQFACPRCLSRIVFFDCPILEGRAANGKPKKIKACPECLKSGVTEEVKASTKRLGVVPALVNYECHGRCKPKKSERRHNDDNPTKRRYFQEWDIAKIHEIDEGTIPYFYPTMRMMHAPDSTPSWGLLWRNYLNGIESVDQFFTKQNCWALACWFHHVKSVDDSQARDLLRLIATANLPGVSIMNQYIPGATFPTKVLKGTYYVPPMRQVENVWRRIESKLNGVVRGVEAITGGLESTDIVISTQDARSLSEIPSDSIDHIFTDPPYSWKVQYGEANFLWEAWLELDTRWHKDEIIVNEHRGVSESDWRDMMASVLAECYRVLKPGRWLALCYHDSSEGTWALIQDLMLQAGFIADRNEEALFIEAREKSQKQIVSDNVTKRDLVLNYRKPKPGDSAVTHLYIPADADDATFQDLGRQFIKEYLTTHPGSPKDRIYDEVVSRMVRRGEMEAHDFESLLRSVAEEVTEPVKKNLFEKADADLLGSHVITRWYLKETADQIDTAEQDKENAAAERLERFMVKYLTKHPETEGVHYSDLFEQIIVIPVEQRPRRLFENWLPEYFFKTPDGTWRPPADEAERQQKAAIREAGTLRRMKRFANALLEEVPVREQDRPDSARTLAEWIRQCRRAGLYEQGRVMYEKGGLDLDRLNEDEQIEVEDDYRICVKRGSEEEAPKKSKGRKKKS